MLPEIASNSTLVGSSGGTSTGKNGWSVRRLFVGEPFAPDIAVHSNNGVVSIDWYTYNPDQIAQQQIFGLQCRGPVAARSAPSTSSST